MKTTIGIFQGKQAENNKYLLKKLYDNGPLSAWGLIPSKTPKGGKPSLHAIYNKRLHLLAKKGYVEKEGKVWILTFKGVIACLIIQDKPEIWSSKWTERINQHVKILEEKSKPYLGVSIKLNDKSVEIADSLGIIQRGIKSFDSFERWVLLSNEVKRLIDAGVVNFDVIKNKTLMLLIVSQASHDTFDIGYGE